MSLRLAVASAMLLAAAPVAAQSDSVFNVTNDTRPLLRVNADGNVGIATRTPDRRLVVDSGGVIFRGQDGFAVLGRYGGNYAAAPGTLPASGAGARLMWHGGRGALRGGYAGASTWSTDSIGFTSFAFGDRAEASGANAFSFGFQTRAAGGGAIAIGDAAVATGETSFSLGQDTHATGNNSYAIGIGARAVHARSLMVSLGAGSVSLQTPATFTFNVSAFTVWFGRDEAPVSDGTRFINTGTGGYLSSGGAWTNASDAARKHEFLRVDGEDVLGRLRTLPIQSWSYRAEEGHVRHLGPTAQDFRAAFGLGLDDTSIATVDADGVALAAAQALEARTRAQEVRIGELETVLAEVRATIAVQAGEIAELRGELAKLRGSRK